MNANICNRCQAEGHRDRGEEDYSLPSTALLNENLHFERTNGWMEECQEESFIFLLLDLSRECIKSIFNHDVVFMLEEKEEEGTSSASGRRRPFSWLGRF